MLGVLIGNYSFSLNAEYLLKNHLSSHMTVYYHQAGVLMSHICSGHGSTCPISLMSVVWCPMDDKWRLVFTLYSSCFSFIFCQSCMKVLNMFPFQFVCDRIQINRCSIVRTTWLPFLTLDKLSSRAYQNRKMKGLYFFEYLAILLLKGAVSFSNYA